MTNSKLLKEAIADAKAVRETAIANAKIALEEAFTPRLQSILSQKLQTEMEDDDDDDIEGDLDEEYGKEDAPTGDSSTLGGKPGGTPSGKTTKSHTALDPETDTETSAVGSELDDVTVIKEEEDDEDEDGVIDDPTGASVTEDEDGDEDDQFDDTDTEEVDDEELDLESIIKELESEIDDEDEFDDETEDDFGGEDSAPIEDGFESEDEAPVEDELGDDEELDIDFDDDTNTEDELEDDGDIDLDEILREMGYGDDEEDADEAPEAEFPAEKEEELEEAYNVIRQLQGTINEVNLLNAKLLYSNKLFRSYDLTNEQKMKIVETLDRTVNIREVKLVFATLAESLQVGGTTKRRKQKTITESFASNAVASTAPKKEIISENYDYSERFKQLANIK